MVATVSNVITQALQVTSPRYCDCILRRQARGRGMDRQQTE